ncbi:aconitate hydratase AcnA [Cryobacterium tepidiphilum]|uniref:Aconitate hydratase n=1 Tax=Cryobacterium tepidiphilum TaxID=2486026 RepID=A0A3M8LNU1_9MICO|nr:aconitate hydratase AcnA [Cryobacterium tepidiphilum]RNE67031.1 aconitate hydratase AcnA [Cryobacterium tepidiphilum]
MPDLHHLTAASAPLDSFGTIGTLAVDGRTYRLARLAGVAPDRLPYTIRILLENLLRNEDGVTVDRAQIEALLDWGSPEAFATPIALTPGRAFLHDTNGVPALADLASMRDAMRAIGGDPADVNPRIRSELVIDHSVVADFFGSADAAERNGRIEYERNAERYRFLRWGQQSLRNFQVVPPGTGIMHQVNVEYLAHVIDADNGWLRPDVCLGTDSHTTMVNGLGVLGWGIGGIEAEAAMLGETVDMLIPRVVGFRLTGTLPEGATATDLVLTITELLRAHGVVGAFVEFHGDGVGRVSVPDRLTIANMSPEFGSTCAYFPIDDETLRYLRFTGRSAEQVAIVEAYAREQGLWHRPEHAADYTERIELDLATVRPSLAGPRRPQDRVPLADAKPRFAAELVSALGAGADPAFVVPVTLDGDRHELGHGAVAIAAITSCTNTSNPSVMVAAGLLARNAARLGLRSKPWVKTTLSPGSRVVTDYLDTAGLTAPLEQLGFHLAGYGCMTCIGASGPLIPEVEEAVREHGLSVVSVLSGNRNFDGRINPDARMNYLASPPLVVAYAVAGTMDIDLYADPLGQARDGSDVYLRDLWPSSGEISEVIESCLGPEMFERTYRDVFTGDDRWRSIDAPSGATFEWDEDSTYLRRPPYFDGMGVEPEPVTDIEGARVLVYLGDTVTTDHVSPAGAIPAASVAGEYLAARGVERFQLNTYASRRGNHEVMMRGTFANVRLQNRLVPGVEGGYTLDFAADGEMTSIYDAAMASRAAGTPLVVLGGQLYGSGSSRDWAAKGPALLGVRAVIAQSFERIHRSNLIGMGVLPLEFLPGEGAESLGLTGSEVFHIRGLGGIGHDTQRPTATVAAGGTEFTVTVRLDTPREREIYRHGGIMKFVLRRLQHQAAATR